MRFFFLSIGIAAVLVACDSEVTTTSGAGASGPGSGPSSSGSGVGQGGAAAEASVVVSHLYVGTKTPGGVEDPKAWAAYGFNLDAQITSSDFSDHCRPQGNAPPNSVFPDGNDGIDNSWGKYLLPIFKTAAAGLGGGEFEIAVNESVEQGLVSWAVVFGIGGSSAVSAPGSFFEVRDRAGDTWLKAPEAFSGDTPLTTFPDAMAQGAGWASAVGSGTLQLNLSFGGLPLPFTVHHPRIRLVVDASGTSVIGGQLGGILDTEELAAAVETSLGPFISCDGSAIDGILNQIRQGSDIMVDGSQDPNQPCNGISFGMAFDGTTQPIGDFAAPVIPPEDPCAADP